MNEKNGLIVRKVIDSYRTIGVMGLAKNTGKTTTLNAIINLYPKKTIGLTSIGLDGESLDQVNFLPKPRIYVRPGMVVATADSCLQNSTVIYEELFKTGYHTAIGEIILAKILSEGHLIVAGTTTNRELALLIDLMKRHTDLILIDGAFNRMTFANIHNMEALILATGASYHPSMEQTLLQTQFITEVFASKKTEFPYQNTPMTIETTSDFVMFNDKKTITVMDWFTHHDEPIKRIWIKGALTAKLMDTFMMQDVKNITLVLEDPTKCLLKHTYRTYLVQRNIQIEVIKPCEIILVSLNPWSPSGHHYDAHTFYETMKHTLNIPVIDVCQKRSSYV